MVFNLNAQRISELSSLFPVEKMDKIILNNNAVQVLLISYI